MATTQELRKVLSNILIMVRQIPGTAVDPDGRFPWECLVIDPQTLATRFEGDVLDKVLREIARKQRTTDLPIILLHGDAGSVIVIGYTKTSGVEPGPLS